MDTHSNCVVCVMRDVPAASWPVLQVVVTNSPSGIVLRVLCTGSGPPWHTLSLWYSILCREVVRIVALLVERIASIKSLGGKYSKKEKHIWR